MLGALVHRCAFVWSERARGDLTTLLDRLNKGTLLGTIRGEVHFAFFFFAVMHQNLLSLCISKLGRHMPCGLNLSVLALLDRFYGLQVGSREVDLYFWNHLADDDLLFLVREAFVEAV